MNLPIEIWNIIENKVNYSNLKVLEKSFRSISDKYMSQKAGERLIENADEALSYCISRMPATYCATSKAIEKTIEMLNFGKKDFKINKVLDVGSGTGSATLAVLNQFDANQVICIEQEDLMSDLAKEFFKSSKKIEWIKENVINLAKNKTDFESDLVISSYMINELSSGELETVLDYLWNMTKKALIIVDPGTPDDFKRMYDIRNYLIQKNGVVIAPCTHNLECNILKNQDWCAFTTRVERNKIQKEVKAGDVPFEDEKFTFLAVAKKDFLNEIEFSQENISRILRNPEVTQNYINIKLCSSEGKIIDDKIVKSNKDIFKKVKKAENGDLFVT